MIKRIECDDKLFAIIIFPSFNKTGIEFFTPSDSPQQIGYMNRPRGYKIAPHYHRKVERMVVLTQEVLYVKSGTVRVSFYNDNEELFDTSLIATGDVIFIAGGGHAFEFLEDSELIEVKQGPYLGDQDKVTF